MPHVVAHAANTNDVMHASHDAHAPEIQLSLVIKMHGKILMFVPFMQAKWLLLKLTTSPFDSLNQEYANENVMKRIPIAVHNENKANCNENFKTYSKESIGHLYKW